MYQALGNSNSDSVPYECSLPTTRTVQPHKGIFYDTSDQSGVLPYKLYMVANHAHCLSIHQAFISTHYTLAVAQHQGIQINYESAKVVKGSTRPERALNGTIISSSLRETCNVSSASASINKGSTCSVEAT